VSEIADFLTAQYDRLEALARAVADSPGVGVELYGAPDEARRAYRQFLDVIDEDYVLADIESKRRILARHQPREMGQRAVCSNCRPVDPDAPSDSTSVIWPCPDVRDLAAPFSAEPGYDAERWAV